MPVLRIVIADDHPIVRVGIKAFLAEHSIRFTLAGEASSGDELLSLLSATPGSMSSSPISPWMKDGKTVCGCCAVCNNNIPGSGSWC